MPALDPLAADRTPAPAYPPAHRSEHWRTADGTDILIRAIRPEDDAIELAFIRGLSHDAGYNRLLGARKLSAWEIRRLTRIDYDREMALVATTGSGAQTLLLGVARYVRDDAGGAEFAIVVADAWQRRGIGTRLLQALQGKARAAGIGNLHGITLASNQAMQNLGRKLGFVQSRDALDATVRKLAADTSAAIPVQAARAAAAVTVAANDACIAARAIARPAD
jgi:GNAT superfamily N-acetyltransferase